MNIETNQTQDEALFNQLLLELKTEDIDAILGLEISTSKLPPA